MRRFLALCVVLLSMPSLAWSLQYALIIDAGSTSSRAHVFAYTPQDSTTPIPIINEIFNKKTQPGLSSFANTPDLAGPSLKPILDAAALSLESQGVHLSEVPVSVLGTSGMRSLPKDQQNAIYASVRNYIQHHDTFLLNDKNVLTIDGTMEGVYDWLDVNYLLHNFDNPSLTVGAIDMGGGSTQIAFATTDTSRPANEVDVTINHTPYRIFSQSFLGLGADEARQTMTSAPNSPSCYPTGYTVGSASQTGYFNFLPCSVIYTTIISRFDIAENMISTAGIHFVAFSGIYHNYVFFNILQTPTQGALESQINAICYLPWTKLQTAYPSITMPFLSANCANGVYFDELIYNTYQLQGSQLTVTNELNGTGIDWTLGALLYSLVQ